MNTNTGALIFACIYPLICGALPTALIMMVVLGKWRLRSPIQVNNARPMTREERAAAAARIVTRKPAPAPEDQIGLGKQP